VRLLLESLAQPVVLDADALDGLEPFERAGETVLTPHSGELARLLDATAAEIDAHRLAAVRRAASRFGAVVALKGRDTLVAAPRAGVLVAAYGRPSLATAGTGDVLTGITATLLSQGLSPLDAASTAAYWHGLAGRRAHAARRVGVIAGDLPAVLAAALPVPVPAGKRLLRVL
jgi:hydroxyethylthiazole kinase-like uncharacterized protein yjeF